MRKVQLFDFLLRNEKIYPLFTKKAEKSLESLLRYLLLQRLIYKLIFWNVKNKKYLVYGLKYKAIIESLPKDETVVLGGGRSVLEYCFKKRISSLFIYHFFKYLIPFSQKDDSVMLVGAIEKLSYALKKTGAKYLILETDSLPGQRMLISAAKKVNIKSICMYHGLTSSKTITTLRDGYVADYVFVYDKYQKKTLVDSGVDTNKIFIFGFYYSSQNNFPPPVNRNKICFFGQPWKEYNTDKFEDYFVIAKWSIAKLVEHGFSVTYKAHPAEKDLSFLEKVSPDILVSYSDISGCWDMYDIFISTYSTALLEATLHGKLAVQIYSGELYDDKLEANSYAYTIDIYDEVSLINHLKTSCAIEPVELMQLNKVPLEIRLTEVISRLDNEK